MGKSRRRKFGFDIRPAAEYLGLAEVIKQLGKKEFWNSWMLTTFSPSLPPAKRQQLIRRAQPEAGRTNK